MKTLRGFTLETGNWGEIILRLAPTDEVCQPNNSFDFDTTEQAFNWLEQNGYIEKTAENEPNAVSKRNNQP